MAKSDSFFIRASVDTNGTTYAQNEIDLGSFVNLGVSKSTLLRVHNMQVQILDASDPAGSILPASASKLGMQLCTQSQTALVYATDKSLVGSGSIQYFYDTTSTAHGVSMSESWDQMPQEFTKGYLVGVDSMFLGAELSAAFNSGDVTISVILEVTLETATQASATALALSQQ